MKHTFKSPTVPLATVGDAGTDRNLFGGDDPGIPTRQTTNIPVGKSSMNSKTVPLCSIPAPASIAQVGRGKSTLNSPTVAIKR